MIFGHSQTVSEEDDGVWGISFGMSSFCTVTVAGEADGEDDDTFSVVANVIVVVVVAVIIDVIVDAVVVISVIVDAVVSAIVVVDIVSAVVIIRLVIDVADVVASSSVTLRHDAIIINVKTSKSRNGLSILKGDMCNKEM